MSSIVLPPRYTKENYLDIFVRGDLGVIDQELTTILRNISCGYIPKAGPRSC